MTTPKIAAVLKTYLPWYREGRTDETEFRSVTDLRGLDLHP
ncbi:hypothetical protein OHB07_38640 (plasmid) [Streptomyces sp. NBC_00111]